MGVRAVTPITVDNLTHSLLGLTLSNTALGRAGRGVTAALLVASNVPDIEIVTALSGGRLAYLQAHRGATHGPVGLIGLAVASAAAVRLWPMRPVEGRPRAGFWALAGVSLIGTLLHILLDFATSYGTRVLSPFSEVWYGVDWMPIIDPLLLAVLTACLVIARLAPRARSQVALAALLLGAGDYAVRAWSHHAAIQIVSEGPAAARLPSEMFRYLWPNDRPETPAALPSGWSPFRWRVIRTTPEGYLLSELDLLSPGTLGRATLHRRDAGEWVEVARAAPTARVFVAFMRFPAIYVSRRPNGDIYVRFNDVRFARPGVETGADGSNPASRFGAFVRLDPAGRVLRDGLGPG